MARRRVLPHFAVSPDDENVLAAFRSQLQTSNLQSGTKSVETIPKPLSEIEHLPNTSSEIVGATSLGGLNSSKPESETSWGGFPISNAQLREPAQPVSPPTLTPSSSERYSQATVVTMKPPKGLQPSHRAGEGKKENYPTPNRPLSPMAAQFIPHHSDHATTYKDARREKNTYPPPLYPDRLHPKYVTEQPAPNSIYADVTPAQLARERAETLERRIRMNREAEAAQEHARQLQFAKELAAHDVSPASRFGPTSSVQEHSTAHSPEQDIMLERALWGEPANPTTHVSSPTPLSTEAAAQAKNMVNKPGTQKLDHPMEELLSTNSPYKDPAILSPDLQRRVREEVGSNAEEAVAALLEKLSLAGKARSQKISPLPDSEMPKFASVGQGQASAPIQAARPKKSSQQERATLEQWTDFAHAEQEKTYDTAEAQLFFKSYPKPEKRQDGGHLPRRAIIQNLPPTATRKLVASIVFGGSLEELRYEPGSPSAYVTFMVPGGAAKFYDETDNGIELPGTPPTVISVELDSEPIPVSGLLKQLMGVGVTRCVKIVGVNASNMDQLVALARGTNPQRQIESVQAKKLESGIFAATINFCSMKDGYSFLSSLRHNEDWEHCNIQYVEDPCSIRERPCP